MALTAYAGPEIPAEQWWSETESPKAWMSVRDADLLENVLHRLAAVRDGQTLRVLEWGAGRSTAWYTGFLEALRVPYRWLSLEHDRAFVDDRVEASLAGRTGVTIVRDEPDRVARVRDALAADGTVVVSFPYGTLRPDLPGHEDDRTADLDDYVGLPAEVGLPWDLVVVDGRKRRRCLLQGRDLLVPEGVAMIHDAWRVHYRCAFPSFAAGRRVGDEWWIGSRTPTDFAELLPWHAFERHAEPPS